MRFPKAVVCAALALAFAMPAAAQQQSSGESNPLEAILNFLRGIFGGTEADPQAPAASERPADPPQQPPAAGEPRQPTAAIQPEPVKATPVAQTSLNLHAVVA